MIVKFCTMSLILQLQTVLQNMLELQFVKVCIYNLMVIVRTFLLNH